MAITGHTRRAARRPGTQAMMDGGSDAVACCAAWVALRELRPVCEPSVACHPADGGHSRSTRSAPACSCDCAGRLREQTSWTSPLSRKEDVKDLYDLHAGGAGERLIKDLQVSICRRVRLGFRRVIHQRACKHRGQWQGNSLSFYV